MSNNQSKPRIEAVTVLSKSAIPACSNSIRESRLIAWAKLESWTAVEAAAIVLERDPDLISWEDVQSLPPSEEFTLQFKHVRRLILRATELSDDKSPSNIIRHLIANDVHVPSYVKDAIDTHGTEPPSDTRRRDRRIIDRLKKQVRRLEQSPEGRRQRNIQLVLARLAVVNAGYTPRAYVQRLVDVTVMEPLRADWAAALKRAEQAKEDGDEKKAVAHVRAFHHQLCATRVLDPACGTGNFLYVSLELMKKLEGEVLETLAKLGEPESMGLDRETVDPHQFLGLELNPRAAAIAELVVWLGYLQQHYRTRSGHPSEPILRAFENINFGRREGYDAVLTWDGYPLPRTEAKDGGRVETYPGARRPAWPQAEFIVGNPPFSGVRLMRATLGSSYVDALRAAYPDVPETSDYVVYWWHRSALEVSKGFARRFGLICTNSISQIYSRSAIRRHLVDPEYPIKIVFAIPDHPWVDTADGANVRVAVIVAEAARVASGGATIGVISEEVGKEISIEFSSVNRISESLKEERGINDAPELLSSAGICFQGVVPAGEGFKLTMRQANELRRVGEGDVVKNYIIGKDLMQSSDRRFIIDCYGIESETVRKLYPHVYHRLMDLVYEKRKINPRKSYRDNWWIFAEPRPAMREACRDIFRFIGTPYTSKHRVFVFVQMPTLPDAMVYAIASDDAFILSVLSSIFHHAWSVETASRMGVGNDYRYTKSRTFDPFPFPDPPEALKARLRAVGEELDALRKKVQATHPDLTLTGLYNVLEKIRAGAPLDTRDADVKQRGLVLILKELHDTIDALTAEAYGWPADLSDTAILERLVALNAERAKEEAAGHVRWLRPDYQIPRFAKGPAAKTGELDLADTVVPLDTGARRFPADRDEQPLAVEALLHAEGRPMDAAAIARAFKGGGRRIEQRVAQVLTTLARYGHIAALPDGRYLARRAA